MSKKRESLGNLFSTPAEDTAQSEKRQDRIGKRAVLFQLPEAAKKQLAYLAIEQDRTQQELLVEGLNHVFTKYGKPPIA